MLIVDSSSVKEIPATKATVRRFLITETARAKLGGTLYANMVMLGVLLRATKVVSAESVENAIKERTSQKTADTNVRAFREGLLLEPAG